MLLFPVLAYKVDINIKTTLLKKLVKSFNIFINFFTLKNSLRAYVTLNDKVNSYFSNYNIKFISQYLFFNSINKKLD